MGLERSRDWVPFNHKSQTCKLCFPRVWDGDSSWESLILNLNLDLDGLDNVRQQFVDPQPNHISPEPGEMDPIGL